MFCLNASPWLASICLRFGYEAVDALDIGWLEEFRLKDIAIARGSGGF